MFNPLTGSVRPSFKRDARLEIGETEFRRARRVFSRRSLRRRARAYFFAALGLKSRGTCDMFSVPPTIKTEPCPAAMRSKAVVTASKPGGAVAMDRHGRHRFRHARPQGDDARDVRGFRRLADAAENDLVDQLRIEPGAGQQRVHGDAAQFVGARAMARWVFHLQKGVRTPSTMTRRGALMACAPFPFRCSAGRCRS